MRQRRAPGEASNYVAEWYGHQVWPQVDGSPSARHFQTNEMCPFMSAALRSDAACVKVDRQAGGRTGVCTISSTANGTRQNWLACPFRVLDANFSILAAAVRRLFGVADADRAILRPLIALDRPAIRDEIVEALGDGAGRVFVFTQTTFGGEVKVPETPASPSVGIDSSVVELLPDDRGSFRFGRYMIFEIQTADFHGSPLHAIRNLNAARDANPTGYHAALAANLAWPGERVEGPNKANVFKRTVYQTILKIQLTRDPDCAGFVITLPEAVWDSWRTHLGLPQLKQEGSILRLSEPHAEGVQEGDLVEPDSAWIYVFDIDEASLDSPRPLIITKTIVTTSAALIHYSFERAPEEALERGAMAAYKRALEARVRLGWNGALAAQRAGRS